MSQVEAAKALVKVINAVICTIEETPGGCPAGVLYAGLMSQGCSLHQWEAIERIMLESGRVVKMGDVLLPAA